MLLRSSSTPILNSWIPNSVSGFGSSLESEALPRLIRTRSVSLTTPFDEGFGKTTPMRIACDSEPMKAKKTARLPALPKPGKIQEKKDVLETPPLFLHSSASGAAAVAATESEGLPDTLVPGGGTGVGGDCNKRPFDGSDSGSQDPRSWLGQGCNDSYYQTMIDANPGDPLLLANYAKFLKEVKGDTIRAEEYYGRAILENPRDSNALSHYADLIWQTHRDAERADTYFNQAVRTDPNDCYVLASYAHFLWDVEDSEE
ncbi:hypothetical protein M569_07905, partial [Genlisea aurea]